MMLSTAIGVAPAARLLENSQNKLVEINNAKSIKIVSIVIAVLGVAVLILGIVLSVFAGTVPLPLTISLVVLGVLLFVCGLTVAIIFHCREILFQKHASLLTVLVDSERFLNVVRRSLEDAGIVLQGLEDRSNRFKDGQSGKFRTIYNELSLSLATLDDCIKASSSEQVIADPEALSKIKEDALRLKTDSMHFLELLHLHSKLEDCKVHINLLCQERELPEGDAVAIWTFFESFHSRLDMLFISYSNTRDNRTPDREEAYNASCKDFSEDLMKELQLRTSLLMNLDFFLDHGLTAFQELLESARSGMEKMLLDLDRYVLNQELEGVAERFAVFERDLAELCKGALTISEEDRGDLDRNPLPASFIDAGEINNTLSNIDWRIRSRVSNVSKEYSAVIALSAQESELAAITRILADREDYSDISGVDELIDLLRDEADKIRNEERNTEVRLTLWLPRTCVFLDRFIKSTSVDDWRTEQALRIEASVYAEAVIQDFGFPYSDTGINEDIDGLFSKMRCLFEKINNARKKQAVCKHRLRLLTRLSNQLGPIITDPGSFSEDEYSESLDHFFDGIKKRAEEVKLSLNQTKQELKQIKAVERDLQENCKKLQRQVEAFRRTEPFFALKDTLDASQIDSFTQTYIKENALTEENVFWIRNTHISDYDAVRLWIENAEKYLKTISEGDRGIRQRFSIFMNTLCFEDWFKSREAEEPVSLPTLEEVYGYRKMAQELLSEAEQVIIIVKEAGCLHLSQDLQTRINLIRTTLNTVLHKSVQFMESTIPSEIDDGSDLD